MRGERKVVEGRQKEGWDINARQLLGELDAEEEILFMEMGFHGLDRSSISLRDFFSVCGRPSSSTMTMLVDGDVGGCGRSSTQGMNMVWLEGDRGH